jgi:hypothetical protein
MARYEGMRSGLDDRYSVVHHTEPSYVQHIRTLDRGYEDDPSEDEIEAKLTDDDVLWRNEKSHETALHFAASHGHQRLLRAIVRRSLDLGVSLDRANVTGTAPLHYACMNGHEPVALDLINAGASIELATKKGVKPLAFAEFYFHYEMVPQLTRAAAERAERASEAHNRSIDARAIADGASTMHGQLAAFYAKHDAAKVGDVAAILTKYKGNEAKLYTELELKYGARP